MKKCTKCGIEKELNDFHVSAKGLHGRQAQCRECLNKKSRDYMRNRRENGYKPDPNWPSRTKSYVNKFRRKHNFKWSLKYKYGLSVADYERMYEEQNGVCAICGLEETRKANGKVLRLSVDHCHETNCIRGLLCDKCNNGIGRFNDDIDIMASAISYLQQNYSGQAIAPLDSDNSLEANR